MKKKKKSQENKNELYPEAENLAKNATEKIKNNNKINKRNKEFILKFVQHCKAKQLTDMRVVFHLTKLRFIAENATKDFDKWDREDVEKALKLINKKSGTPETKNGYIACLKCFFRFILGLDSDDPLPKWIKWVKKESSPSRLKKEDLWTDEELQRFFNSIHDPMWKSLFCVLWEGALRPGEARGIKIKDCIVDNEKIKIYVRGKMAKKQGDRPIYIIRSYSILKHWLDIHKFKNDPEAYLFCDGDKKPIAYNTILVKMKRIAKKCNIAKLKAHPYIFRHITGTQMYKKQPPVIARKFMGHGINSRMEAVYCHLNEEDLEEALMGMNGNGKQKEELKEIIMCSRCHKANKLGSETCSSCGFIFTDSVDENEVRLALKLLKALRILEGTYPKELKDVFEGIIRQETS